MMRKFAPSMCVLMAIFFTSQVLAQSLQDRIKDYKDKQRNTRQRQSQIQPSRPTQSRLDIVLPRVDLRDTPARDAFAWWSQSLRVPLVIDWETMVLEGIDPERGITLILRDVPAGRVLGLLASQVSPEQPLIMENTPWYIKLMTREQANRETVVRVYDVADLIMRIRNFDDAPEFDLDTALSNTQAGASGGGGSSGQLFTDSDQSDTNDDLTREDRGEMLADLIRETIEPEIWGVEGSIRYFQGRMIIKAPRYVHQQIGIPVAQPKEKSRYPKLIPIGSAPRNQTPEGEGVASVSSSDSQPVSGTTNDE